jgi:hypothetical protein
MGIRRGDPYIWVSWLPPLLAGEAHCEWAAWLKAHYRDYDRVPDTLDPLAWAMEHTDLLRKALRGWERKGYSVTIRDQNYFRLVGRDSGIILAGTPDLVAIKGRSGTILDARTGKPKDSHRVQVLIYMWALPALTEYRNVEFEGRIVYKDDEVTISPYELDEDFAASLIDLIERVGGKKPLQKVPRVRECSFCTIAKSACPERLGPEREPRRSVKTDDF